MARRNRAALGSRSDLVLPSVVRYSPADHWTPSTGRCYWSGSSANIPTARTPAASSRYNVVSARRPLEKERWEMMMIMVIFHFGIEVSQLLMARWITTENGVRVDYWLLLWRFLFLCGFFSGDDFCFVLQETVCYFFLLSLSLSLSLSLWS